jgi:hypothetical protein
MVRPGNNTGGYYGEGFRGKRIVCDVCGLWFYPDEIEVQDGLQKCTVTPRCIDVQDDDDD